MSELMRNPHVMAKAQTKIREVLKGKKNITEIDIQEQKYLKFVINETIRLHPPDPLLAPRETAIGGDEDYWSNPESFFPERFENSHFDYSGNYYEYTPCARAAAAPHFRRPFPPFLFSTRSSSFPPSHFSLPFLPFSSSLSLYGLAVALFDIPPSDKVICSLISRAAWFTSATSVYWRILRPSALTVQEVDDIDTGVIQGPPSSPTQIASFAKKSRLSSVGTWFLLVVPWVALYLSIIFSRHFQCSHRGVVLGNLYWTVVLMELRGALLDYQVAGPDLDMPSFSLGLTPPAHSHPGGLDTSYAPPSPDLGFSSFQAPPPLGLGFSSFQAPLSPGIVCISFQAPPPSGTAPTRPDTVGSYMPHMPISYASSFDSDEHDDERTDDVTLAQQLRFGHRVEKKTTRSTPSDWP
ncbi:hypothetical protein M9H77_25494 [Catharanthus roseus]|uniref:Uncharacterized protein n=1 Tax=Catharanthus roseus TaxID=4058 RepID=A0ACC0AB30_CATRO|nr:hypothetical protein M9H77_25494 [Catharanthus roseus]